MINIQQLFNWNYLTEQTLFVFAYSKLMLFILIALTLILIPLFIFSKKRITPNTINRGIFLKIFYFFLFSDIYGYLAYLGRIQSLPFLSMRIMLLLWPLSIVIGGIVLAMYMIFGYKGDMEKFNLQEQKKKYLPRRK